MKHRAKIFLFVLCSLYLVQPGYSQSWQWAAHVGGPMTDINNSSPDESIKSMVTDSQGNVYVCGTILSPALLNGAPITTYGSYDIFIAKYDCNGDTVWIRTAGGSAQDYAYDIALDTAGYLYVTGRLYATTTIPCHFIDTTITELTRDFYIAKLDTSGNRIWLMYASPGPAEVLGIGYFVELDGNNKLRILLGVSTPGILFPGYPVVRGIYYLTLDPTGNVLSLVNINNVDFVGRLNDFKISLTGENYLIGEFYSDSLVICGYTFYKTWIGAVPELFMVKFDLAANYVWVKHISATVLSFIQGYGLSINANGEVLICGSAADSIVIGSDTLLNLLNSTIGEDFPFVAKYDSQGQALWATNSQHQYIGECTAGLISLNNGSVYYGGFFAGQAIFGSSSFTSTGMRDFFMAEVNPSGVVVKAEHIQTTGGNDEPECITRDANDNIYIGGGFSGSMTINGNTYASAGGNTDAFIAKYGVTCPVGIDENSTVNDDIIIYPNPAYDKLNVEIKGKGAATLSIINLLGETVFRKEIAKNQNRVDVDVSGLPSGMYMLKSESEHAFASQKFVKE